ncbi:hypothetical protein N7532_009983 [Penicillium argentinense]|uniref:Uncharacterized protein n=1 Tax=Penicillium argentinense TaxID=1131581 RepID=A0A9W9ENQ2_9EURO|nr:uncharacterized protein N7532_009983 [Penicillium argentinense]KAJ5085212.1 hypothetical protein N7532_009983 [Penicillium argentinense]
MELLSDDLELLERRHQPQPGYHPSISGLPMPAAVLVDMLNMGTRVFDLRFALASTNTSLIFYPSEAVFLSFQHERSAAMYASKNAAPQSKLYQPLMPRAARDYFVQRKDELGTLGE